MKIIIDTTSTTAPYDNITTLTASSEDANFPSTNLRDDFTTNLWKAASGTSAVLSLILSKGSSVAVFNTNATSVTVEAGAGESYILESGYELESGYSLVVDEVAVIPAYDLDGENGRFWADYTEFTVPHVVTITLTAASVPYAGIVRGGNVESFRDPATGMGESSIDYSVERELNNGADYFRKRNVVRTFEGMRMLETRANAWLFKHDIFDSVGPQPLAIRLIQSSSITDDEFVMFAKRIDPPQLEHATRTHTRIHFSLREVI